MADDETTEASLRTPPRTGNRRWKFAILLVAATALFVVLVFARARAGDQVLPGVRTASRELSGQDRAALHRTLEARAEELRERPIALRVADKSFQVRPQELGFEVNVEATADRALEVGRRGGVLSQFAGWLRRIFVPEEIPLEVSLDDAALAQVVQDVSASAISKRPFPGALVYRSGAVSVDPPRPGMGVDLEQLRRAILDALVLSDSREVTATLMEQRPNTVVAGLDSARAQAERLVSGEVTLTSEGGDVVFRVPPEELGRALTAVVVDDGRRVELAFDSRLVAELLAKDKERLEAPPRNAELSIDERDRVVVTPGRSGTRISAPRVAEALLLAAHAPARHGVLPLVQGAEPEVKTDDLLALRITGLLARFSTSHPCCQPRVKNIHRIADMLDGMLVRPGQIVSINATVGPRTTKNGFVEAPTIEEGEMVDSLGGGVSQFATTFYNALFYGGYDIIERQPHSFYFARYPMGHEATLSWPKPDIIFRNDTEAGMLIQCTYTETSITVKIFGDNGGRKVRASRSAQFDVQRPPVELLPNPELPPDEEKLKEGGQIGWSVIVGREISFPDGRKKEEKRKVVYKPRVRRVEVHPCRIPEGEPGHTGERCPVPEAGPDRDAEL